MRPYRSLAPYLIVAIVGAAFLSAPASLFSSDISGGQPLFSLDYEPPSDDTIEERVPADAVPPKEAVTGLDEGLSRVSRLVEARGELPPTLLATEAPGVRMRGGLIQAVAEVEADATTQVADAVRALGGIVEVQYETLLQLLLPPEALGVLSTAPGVRYLRSPLTPSRLEVLSEGRAGMNLEPWYQQGFLGAGAKIAIADLGFDGYWNLLASELPRDVIIRSFRIDGDITGGGDPHGTAAAEIAYDIAPQAIFYLVNFSTEAELGIAVDWLISEKVHVISSSVGWPGTAQGDGTGTVNSIVEKAERGGLLWVQAAGNFAQTHWTGQFVDPDGNGFHNFAGADEGNTIQLRRSRPSEERVFRVEIFLTWDDWAALSQDYDLFLFRGESVVAQSTAFQNGKFPPVEHIVYTSASPGDYWIAIQRFRATRRVKLDLVITTDYNTEHVVTAESLVIPADSPHALTVGAVEPGTLNARPYSSQGPTKDGRIKPDLVAGDQVSTLAYGERGFFGTSAAAPHVAGAAALLKSARPDFSPAELRRQLMLRAQGPGPGSGNTLVGAGYVALGPLAGDVFLPFTFSGFNGVAPTTSP